MSVTPYHTETSKKEQVEEMFNSIAPKYDFLNHFLSLGIDKIWRKKAINELKKNSPVKIIDIATGTGDLAIQACKTLKEVDIVGIDLSEQMLKVGKEKIIKGKLNDFIHLQTGDAEQIAFPDGFFDAAMVAFGVRNFENLKQGLCEINRVIKSNGRLVILEFSIPTTFLIRGLFKFYFKRILPFLGNRISKDKSAYTYLPASVEAFPQGEDMLDIIHQSGFSQASYRKLSFGIASLYTCIK